MSLTEVGSVVRPSPSKADSGDNAVLSAQREPGAVPIDELREEHFAPKWYLNGFPKSGLHWVSLMMLPVATPQFGNVELWSQPWAGTFRLNSWSTLEVPLERVTYKISKLGDGRLLKAHSGYSEDLERFLWFFGASVVFIYRDFRDVAVSQAFHVLSDDDDKQAHPDKPLYKRMDAFEDVLEAVIVGVDKYPGVMDRWAYYAGWLDVGWVCHLRFEEIKADTHAAAVKLLRYGVERSAKVFDLKPNVLEENLQLVAGMMVEAGKQTQKSPTFRKGAVGDWREYFTPRLARLFAQTDRDDWLVRLGYADEGWADGVY